MPALTRARPTLLRPSEQWSKELSDKDCGPEGEGCMPKPPRTSSTFVSRGFPPTVGSDCEFLRFWPGRGGGAVAWRSLSGGAEPCPSRRFFFSFFFFLSFLCFLSFLSAFGGSSSCCSGRFRFLVRCCFSAAGGAIPSESSSAAAAACAKRPSISASSISACAAASSSEEGPNSASSICSSPSMSQLSALRRPRARPRIDFLRIFGCFAPRGARGCLLLLAAFPTASGASSSPCPWSSSSCSCSASSEFSSSASLGGRLKASSSGGGSSISNSSGKRISSKNSPSGFSSAVARIPILLSTSSTLRDSSRSKAS
mmetsp:Transcript_157409/g.286614  ORF Transcript_157409/g.286614 Transcript_157409/m.286614 type:complete len:313 (+) Transcript_157409:323-1261(+)